MWYSDILGLKEGFSAYYVITNEEDDSKRWNTFIPHESFYQLLEQVLRALKRQEGKGSVWLQGPYGVGKTHACAVIKHLLSDDYETIKAYIDSSFEGFGKQIGAQILALRQNKKYLTVALKGFDSIPTVSYISYFLQQKIKDTLLRYGLELPTFKTDVERIYEHISLLREEVVTDKLSDYSDYKVFLRDLKDGRDKAIIEAINILESEGVVIATPLDKWFSELKALLHSNGFDGIFIIWDEFTDFLRDERVISFIQNQLAEHPDVHLLIVTHRTEENIRRYIHADTIEKIKDRFWTHRFEMKEITAFEVISRTFEKKNKKLWEKLKNERMNRVKQLVKAIASERNVKENLITNLYPFHPYTSFLISYMAGQFLSAERSIFEFLYSERGKEKKGFQMFLEKDIGEELFLTPDYLWDFFHELLDDKTTSDVVKEVIYRYSEKAQNIEAKFKDQKDKYLKILKVVVLMNAIYRSVKDAPMLLRPHEDNVELAFAGTPIHDEFNKLLNELVSSGIVPKDPDGTLFVHVGELPDREIREKVESLRKSFPNFASVVLNNADAKSLYENTVISRIKSGVLRVLEYITADIQDSRRLRPKIEKMSKHALRVVFGLPTKEIDIAELKKDFKKLSEEYKDVVFMVPENFFGEDTISRWIEYRAKAEVARAHNNVQWETHYTKQANKIVEDFLKTLVDGYVYVSFRGKSDYIPFREVSQFLGKQVAMNIFEAGAENITDIPETVWNRKATKDFIDKLLTAKRRKNLEDRTIIKGQQALVLPALKAKDGRYVVSDNFKVEDTDPYHPIVRVRDAILEALKDKDSCNKDCFRFLREPPYGLYNNQINAFILTMAFRAIKDELYEEGSGLISEIHLRDFILSILEDSISHTYIRLGSEEDKVLPKLLREAFTNILIDDNKEPRSLPQIKAEIKDVLEKHKCPLWMLKYVNGLPEKLKENIGKISEFLIKHDREITLEEKSELVGIIEEYKYDLQRFISVDNILRGRTNFIENKIKGRSIDRELVGKRIVQELSQDPNFWDEAYVSRKVDEIINRLLRESREEEAVKGTTYEPGETKTKPIDNKQSEDSKSTEEENTDLNIYPILKKLTPSQFYELIKHLIDYNPASKRIAIEWLRRRGFLKA